MLELDDTIFWPVFGKDPFSARIDARETLRRWMTPLQPFHEHPGLCRRRRAPAAE